MTDVVDAPATTQASISRRRVVQGVAWATPAVLIASASPHAAASVVQTAIVVPTIEGYAVSNGNSNQNIDVTLSRSAAAGVTASVVVTRMEVDFIKVGPKSQQSGAVVKAGEWVLNTGASIFPTVAGVHGLAVFDAVPALTLTPATYSGQMTFNLDRFSSIPVIRFIGTSNGVPFTASWTPPVAP